MSLGAGRSSADPARHDHRQYNSPGVLIAGLDEGKQEKATPIAPNDQLSDQHDVSGPVSDSEDVDAPHSDSWHSDFKHVPSTRDSEQSERSERVNDPEVLLNDILSTLKIYYSVLPTEKEPRRRLVQRVLSAQLAKWIEAVAEDLAEATKKEGLPAHLREGFEDLLLR
jgi:hypothetical protein